jgi:flagellar hook-associated protein 2
MSSSTLDTSSVYRLTGTDLYSGLDTDEIIKALVSDTQSKIDKQQQLEQIAKWKRELLRDVISDMQDFQDTYFSYTSKTNLLSSKFFVADEIISSSDVVSATGDAKNASNIVINEISRLATKASYQCNHTISNHTITSNTISLHTIADTLNGKTLTFNLDGVSKDITFKFEDTDSTDYSDLDNVVAYLNDKLEDAFGSDKKITVIANKEQDTLLFKTENTSTLTVTSGDDPFGITSVETSLNLSTIADVLNGKTLTFNLDGVSKDITFKFEDTDSTDYSDLDNVVAYLNDKLEDAFGSDKKITVIANKEQDTLLFKTEDTSTLTVTSSDDETFEITSDTIAINTLKGKTATFNLDGESKTITFDKNYTDLTEIKKYLAQELNSVFGYGKITVSADNDQNTLLFETEDTTSVLTVTPSDSTLQTTSETIAINSLRGKTATFNLDGVTKTITFDKNYTNLTDVKDYLQKQLNSEFGSISDDDTSKITVSTSDSTLQFKTKEDTSVLTVTSSALGMESSKSNRISLSTTLKDFMGDESESTTYSLTINGETLSFTGDQTLSKVISEINSNGDMGVTVTYSETTDSFYITADETGSQGKIEFEGDLATALFGGNYRGSIDFSQTLENLALNSASGLSDVLKADNENNYSLSIKIDDQVTTLSFNKDQTLEDVFSEINSQNLGITVNYSATSGIFNITADNDTINVQDVFVDNKDCNLATVLLNSMSDGTYTAGQDLKMNVTINGSTMDLERSSNVTSIDGVTLNITGTTDEPVSFSGNDSVDELVSKIVDYVNDYNKIIDKINNLVRETRERDSDNGIAYEPLTDAQKEEMTDEEIEKWNEKAKQGLLQNDSTLNSILQDMYSAMTNEVDSVGMTLYQLGIATQPLDYESGGQFVVDTEKLKEKLLSDPDAVVEMFTGEKGIASRVNDVLNNYVGTFGGDGILIARAGTDSMANDTSELTLQIKQYSDIISDLKDQLETEENRYWNKFTAMEQALSVLTSQSNYLMSMFSSDY